MTMLSLNAKPWGRGLLACLTALVLSASALANPATPSASEQARAEARLVQILDQIQRNEINDALAALTTLTEEIPTFRAAQLLYADLLRMRAGNTAFGASVASQLPAVGNQRSIADKAIPPSEHLVGLQREMKQRRNALLHLPPAGMLPSNFVQLAPNIKHAIAVDASRSRLYLFENSAQGVKLIADFYVTVGRNGVDKRSEGDQRTPLGVYFIGRQLPGKQLPDLYGKGALTLNYPNDWDRLQDRTGSGIWLHGVPPDQYARLPQASDGCVVLANPDIQFLMDTVDRRTPVLISPQLDWITPPWTQPQRTPDAFQQSLDRWQAAWRQGDQQQLKQLYSSELAEAEALQKRRNRLGAYGPLSQLTVQDVSIYHWQEAAGEIRIVNLHVASQRSDTATVRQYWRKQGQRWEIFSEDLLS